VHKSKRIWENIKEELDFSDGECGPESGGGDNKGADSKDDGPVIPPLDSTTFGIRAKENEEASGNEGSDNAGSSVVEDCKLNEETPVCGHEISGVIVRATTSIAGARVRTPNSSRNDLSRLLVKIIK
jgi:hypothetical protein